MKKILITVVAFLVASTPVQAMDSSICPKIGELAGAIMRARQTEMSKEEVLSVVSYGPSRNITISLINLAYSTPIYPLQTMKTKAIETFQMQAEYTCLNSSNI